MEEKKNWFVITLWECGPEVNYFQTYSEAFNFYKVEKRGRTAEVFLTENKFKEVSS